MDEEMLEGISAKLGALLALAIEDRIQNSETADRRRPREIERLLRDVGLPTAEIARLVGKTPRRVRQVLEED